MAEAETNAVVRQHVRHGEEWVIDCPLGGEARARFVTDAVNDYFTRSSEWRPG
jgi:hypothetical protein